MFLSSLSSIYSGLTVVSIWVLWGRSIYCLGTWTLKPQTQQYYGTREGTVIETL